MMLGIGFNQGLGFGEPTIGMARMMCMGTCMCICMSMSMSMSMSVSMCI